MRAIEEVSGSGPYTPDLDGQAGAVTEAVIATIERNRV